MVKKIFFLNLITLLLLFPFLIFAQELQYPQIPGAVTPQPGISLEEFARYIYYFSLIIGAVLSFGIFVYGGILFLTSFGNPQRVKEARERMLSAVFGILVLFSSYLILTILDPHLVVFRVGQITTYRSPQVTHIETPLEMPKSFVQLTTFKENSDDFADFLGNQVRDLLAVDAILFFSDPLHPKGYLDLLKEVKDVNCSSGETDCVVKAGSIDCLPIRCRWKENPEKQILGKIEDTEEGLEKVKEILRKLLESEQVKKVKGDLNFLENCQNDFSTWKQKPFINDQAEIEEILDHFGITRRNPLYFYCFY